MPVEVYDPQARTFLTKPEHKVCAHCGQPIVEAPKPLNNHMNVYVNDETKVEFALNSNEPYVTVKGVKLRRKNYVPPVQASAGSATTPPTTPPSK